jgi:DnaD/phage-associated family protein
MTFSGFPEGKVRLTPIPAAFFSDLLPAIDHLGELKVSIYAFWRLDNMEGNFRYLRRLDLLQDERFLKGLGETPEQAQVNLDDGLERAVRRGTLLQVTLKLQEEEEQFYFLNSPKGRAGAQAMARGDWRPSDSSATPVELYLEAPNIFRLYEEHVGPLTPMIADALRDAENTYPEPWIEEALRIAVENNIRNWRYIVAILERWLQEGRDERKDRRDTQKNRRRYVEGEFSEFIEH